MKLNQIARKDQTNNNKDDDTNILWEEEKEIEEMDVLDTDEEVGLYIDDDKEKTKISFKAHKKKVLVYMKSLKKSFDSSKQDIQMSISLQTIQSNHETKSTIPNMIEPQHNSTKSMKQSIKQEEDKTSTVSSITTPFFAKSKTRVNKGDEFLNKCKTPNSITINIVDSIEQLTTSHNKKHHILKNKVVHISNDTTHTMKRKKIQTTTTTTTTTTTNNKQHRNTSNKQHTNTSNKLNNLILHNLSKYKVDNGNKIISHTASLKPSNNCFRLYRPSYLRTNRQLNYFKGSTISTESTDNSVYNSHQESRNTNLSEWEPRCEKQFERNP